MVRKFWERDIRRTGRVTVRLSKIGHHMPILPECSPRGAPVAACEASSAGQPAIAIKPFRHRLAALRHDRDRRTIKPCRPQLEGFRCGDRTAYTDDVGDQLLAIAG